LKATAPNSDDMEPLQYVNDQRIFRYIFSESEIGFVILDADHRILTWNPWVTKHSGIKLEDILGSRLEVVFPDLQQGRIERAVTTALQQNMTSVVSHTLNRKPFPFFNPTGEFLQQHIIVKPVNVTGLSRFCLIQINDITAAVSREKLLIAQTEKIRSISDKLSQQIERAQVTLDSIADAVITTDEKGLILSMNPVAEILTGCFEDDILNKPVATVFRLIDEENRQPVLCPVKKCLETKHTIANEYDHILLGSMNSEFSITDSAAPIINEDGKLLGAVLVFRDVTQSRSLSAELTWQALHDPLTGLANRRQFEVSMKDLLLKARADKKSHHLLYMDLDQFKVVNDTCGHDAGDELLCQLTDTLEKKLRQSDLLARLGGDEFGVLLENCDSENALAIANNLRKAVEEFRFGWQTNSFRIGVSIGVAEITGEEAKAADILSAADAACYVAKENGRNRVCFHNIDASMSSVQQKEMQWVSKIQNALDHNLFELYLQRIQSVSDCEKSDHYEVLLRMIDQDGGLIPPGAFLPAAERFNLIGNLDTWVVENVFKKIRQLKQQTDKYPHNLVLAINLSGASMINNDLFDRICELLDETDIEASQFCFEVTETAAIVNLTQATKFLSQLREKGCKIALDDFGSGLSSFAYLKELPVDYLKIDGFFVKDIAVDKIDKAFVQSINQIGQVMNLQTIAEFVENKEILDILQTIGVDYAQGYGIHKPCQFDEVFC